MADVNKLDDLLSLHNGSNHNARGAFMLIINYRNKVKCLIFVYPVRQVENDDDLWVFYGDYICIDKNTMLVIEE